MEKEKILFLGLPRTGTLSLYEAVKQLGYNPFHGVVTLGKPEMFTQFDQALTAKFEGRGRKWGAEEWSMFLADYDVSPPFLSALSPKTQESCKDEGPPFLGKGQEGDPHQTHPSLCTRAHIDPKTHHALTDHK